MSALVVDVNDEIDQLRQNLQKVLSDAPSLDLPQANNQVLESLASSLRQANEHLVIASLDASARETKTAEAHRKQTLFLSMLAHELRNPLAPIVMSVELLKRVPDASPMLQRLQGILARQTGHLSRLVDDLMDATRINSGRFRVVKSRLLLSQLLFQAIETSQPLLDARHQRVDLALPADAVWFDGDFIRLSQLLSNLVLNASKFSAEGSTIHISAALVDENVVMSVRDEGIGIAPELQPFVFDLFVQGPVGERLLASGLGIGLSLVRTIAQLHGGSVHVLSPGNGRGSEFVVTLPVVATTDHDDVPANPGVLGEPPLHSPVPSFQARRVLLIDDNADINHTLDEFLKKAGHEVDCAHDGPEGLQRNRAAPYEVICCDIGLPGMSGLEVARQLRARHSAARLIAISAFDQPEHRDQAYMAGFDHYLVKPVAPQVLLALLDLPRE
ncbi:MAG: hybrid sensor histidine kinase/response regulator [Hydrogenophaga sp.]|uniref:hybrid sensor histidine kinase/response regulator n=1 Tax=Hydrogenophaga sp. TaxID=1904254 RepID=UPI0027301F3E|nr:hybrid sensor histidine kinase/response regulator [Hydrogenophaga sp.]MDP2164292.1 hybrid sensor histidine kinase/response regulator [Hydrogenophaga sp.]